MESGDVMKRQSAFMGTGSCQRTNFTLFLNKITDTVDSSSCVDSVLHVSRFEEKKYIQNQYECIINGLKIANGKILKWLCYKGFINE